MNTPCQPGQTPLQTPVQGDFFSQQQTPQGSLGGRDQTFPDQVGCKGRYFTVQRALMYSAILYSHMLDQ